ncbi:MAG: site-specific integrase [Gallionella sp.]
MNSHFPARQVCFIYGDDAHANAPAGLYSAAIADRLVGYNPCKDIILPKLPEPEDTIDPFSAEEIELILNYFSKRNKRYYNLVLFLVETGIRPSELVLLMYSDINIQERKLKISKALDADGGEKLPKNDKKRDVDLTDRALFAIAAQKEHTYKDNNSLIFLGCRSGKRLDMNTFRAKVWYPALKKLEIRQRPVYSLRHTFGTRLVSMGLPMKYVSVQMGHKNTLVTEKHYADWRPESNAPMLDIRNKENALLKVVNG